MSISLITEGTLGTGILLPRIRSAILFNFYSFDSHFAEQAMSLKDRTRSRFDRVYRECK